jgi:hypothetical protein
LKTKLKDVNPTEKENTRSRSAPSSLFQGFPAMIVHEQNILKEPHIEIISSVSTAVLHP